MRRDQFGGAVAKGLTRLLRRGFVYILWPVKPAMAATNAVSTTWRMLFFVSLQLTEALLWKKDLRFGLTF